MPSISLAQNGVLVAHNDSILGQKVELSQNIEWAFWVISGTRIQGCGAKLSGLGPHSCCPFFYLEKRNLQAESAELTVGSNAVASGQRSKVS